MLYVYVLKQLVLSDLDYIIQLKNNTIPHNKFYMCVRHDDKSHGSDLVET